MFDAGCSDEGEFFGGRRAEAGFFRADLTEERLHRAVDDHENFGGRVTGVRVAMRDIRGHAQHVPGAGDQTLFHSILKRCERHLAG